MTSTRPPLPSSQVRVDATASHSSRMPTQRCRSSWVSNSGTTSRTSGRSPVASRASARTATRSAADWVKLTT